LTIPPLKILIVDDFAPWANLLRSLLADVAFCCVIGVVHDGQTALQTAQQLDPDLILLDMHLADASGTDLLHSFRELRPEIRVIFVSQISTVATIEGAFEAGATGYVLKTDVSQDLIPAIQAAQEGKRYLCRSLKQFFSEFEE
jgi:DNA-binding NarL/FixJ family response regulator